MKIDTIKKTCFTIGVIIFILGLFLLSLFYYRVIDQEFYGNIIYSKDEGIKIGIGFISNPILEFVFGILFLFVISIFFSWVTYIYLKYKYKI